MAEGLGENEPSSREKPNSGAYIWETKAIEEDMQNDL
jgi:hypothetical protein